MTNDELLEKIRLDRPNQVIHKVVSYKETKFGYLDVDVVMEAEFFGTKVRNVNMTLPYPVKAYIDLKELLQPKI